MLSLSLHKENGLKMAQEPCQFALQAGSLKDNLGESLETLSAVESQPWVSSRL